VTDSDSVGRWFESSRAYQKVREIMRFHGLFARNYPYIKRFFAGDLYHIPLQMDGAIFEVDV
jgi:hypothetical protein